MGGGVRVAGIHLPACPASPGGHPPSRWRVGAQFVRAGPGARLRAGGARGQGGLALVRAATPQFRPLSLPPCRAPPTPPFPRTHQRQGAQTRAEAADEDQGLGHGGESGGKEKKEERDEGKTLWGKGRRSRALRCSRLPPTPAPSPVASISLSPSHAHARTHASTHARTHARKHARTHARTHPRTHARTHARLISLSLPQASHPPSPFPPTSSTSGGAAPPCSPPPPAARVAT